MADIGLVEARRIALGAQGFATARPKQAATAATLRRAAKRQGVLQIDSVNVAVRAHYMPLFSRLGPYDMGALDALAYRKRHLFEYWGHEASLLPVELFPLFRHRMRPHQHPRMIEWVRKHQDLIEQVHDHVTANGPTVVKDLPEHARSQGGWWGWGEGKRALEHLFLVGAVTTTERRGFGRVYDLTERVIPERYREAPVPPADEAVRALLLAGARALGIGTAKDIADYYRVPIVPARAAIDALAGEGAVEPVRVQGWKDVAYLHPDAKRPRRIDARALLSPFDPVVWERSRAVRLFGFDYRIEIYVPEPKRRYGYYVMPFLLGDTIAARVDLKADRMARTLLVPASYVEDGHPPGEIAEALAAELRTMAAWLGLDDVKAAAKGSLARQLRAALR